MNYSLRDRIAFLLERFKFLDPVLLRFHGMTPAGDKRYVNRINGHLVLRRKS